MMWSAWRARAAKFLAVIGLSLAPTAPAHAIYILVEGQGTVSSVNGYEGAQPTGTVNAGDQFDFLFGVDPASAPLIVNSGPTAQVFDPDIIGLNAFVDDFYFAWNGTSSLTFVTAFRLFPGESASVPVLIQQWNFNGFAGVDPPFAVTPLAGSVSFSLTSFFRQDLGGATPTYANLRDPREAAINSFQFTFREGRTTLGFVSGNFTGGYYSAAVPEPAAWALLILGFGVVGAGMRTARRPRQRALAA